MEPAVPPTPQPPDTTLDDLKREHLPAPPKRHGKVPTSEAQERSVVRNYVRDLILGFNDGLVSVYAAVAGVAGAALAREGILVAGLAFAAAGALSMGMGEYVSTKSQTQYYRSEADREREHIRRFPELERQEIREILEEKDYPPEVRQAIVAHVTADEDRFVDFMMREEFGVGQESERSPLVAMGLVMVAFVVGALLPVAPYLFPVAPLRALALATGLSLAGLFVAGFAKGRVSGISGVRSGLEMVAFGAAAAAVTYAVGRLLGGVLA